MLKKFYRKITYYNTNTNCYKYNNITIPILSFSEILMKKLYFSFKNNFRFYIL